MWNLLFAIPLLALAPLAEAQAGVLDYSKLPSCARQCAQLTQAQAACTTTPSTEKTCFCQSAYLTVQTNLFNTADGTCAAECPSADDRKKIQTWFIGICRNGGSGSGGGSSTPSASASTPSSTPSSQGGQRAESGSSANKDDGNQNKSWWDGHAKWVAMVIVLIIGFVLIIIGGVWLKRRHDRKVNQGSTAPLPAGWGPNSDPHAYPGPNSEKYAGAARSRGNQITYSLEEQGKNRKLQKFFGR